MQLCVFIVGTTHSIQMGIKAVDEEIKENFKRDLRSIIQEQRIEGIAEEMSRDALSIAGVDESIPYSIAIELNIRHIYADPSIEKQSQLGMLDDEAIKWGGFFKDKTEDQIESEIASQNRSRERIWLEVINAFGVNRILFICGSKHSYPFSELIGNAGGQVQVVYPDWQPNHHMSRTQPLRGRSGYPER